MSWISSISSFLGSLDVLDPLSSLSPYLNRLVSVSLIPVTGFLVWILSSNGFAVTRSHAQCLDRFLAIDYPLSCHQV